MKKVLALIFLCTAAGLAQQIEVPAFKVDGIPWEVQRERIIQGTLPDDGATSYLYGFTNCDRHVLQIRTELPPCYERATVMHELMHAAMCDWRQYGKSFEKTQFSGHEAIDKLAPRVMRIVADNPGLANYFAAAPDCHKEKLH